MSTPDWVMAGSQEAPDRFRIVASGSLSRARLEYQARVRREDFRRMSYSMPVGGTYTLTTEFGQMVVAEGATYAEALRALFDRWTPEPAPADPIEAGRSSLTELEGE